jgi:hypothetical protein
MYAHSYVSFLEGIYIYTLFGCQLLILTFSALPKFRMHHGPMALCGRPGFFVNI